MPQPSMLKQSDFADHTARLIKPQALSKSHRAMWMKLRAGNPALYSPYFHIEYADLIASLRDDVNVMVIESGQEVIGFLPVQGHNFARPLGDPFTDYHGIISDGEQDFDLPALLKQVGIGAFYFDALINALSPLPQDQPPRQCAAFDIDAGGEAFRAAQDGSYRRHIKGLRRRARKSEGLGQARVEFCSQNREVFEQLLSWKRAQYDRSGKYDVLAADWTRATLSSLFESGAELRADMHALYFSDRLAAVDLGLTDGVVYHSWITAYDPQFREFSPGMQLLERLIDDGKALGYSRLDLGPGLDGYKKHYSGATGCSLVHSGFVAGSGPAAALSRLYGAAERASVTGALPGKVRRRYTQIASCDSSLSGRLKGIIQAATPASKD